MLITVNGSVVETAAHTILLLLGELPPGHAVAVNDQVVPRSSHGTHVVVEGDKVDVVQAVAGG
ncbi:sulfur carrier protein ThiS [Nocardioides sp. B-3]|uniref:sulfur carrier protein ThiS n=1 Tax=Nocardioides sp. B-3 TaxID=2895565 RepID=UPI0021528DE7|nr:sulfur carrier protein ThiS [Nocardioides sp. B-3]UUZ60259.1 sulfur carrier protein ThiS [Nocardioides sp. B-3]